MMSDSQSQSRAQSQAQPGDQGHARLSAELEAALVRALRREWDNLNWSHLRRVLHPPTLLLSDALSRLGQWSRTDRTIELSRRLVLGHPWGVVVEVLKHEMAHQYADEVMGTGDETAHGPAFRRACTLLGIDPAASGLPRDVAPLEGEEVRVLGRIAKLMALAQGQNQNQNEAELAMREAQRLMFKYNLEAAVARPTTGSQPYDFRHLGEPTGRLQAHERMLASILGSHFFVEPIWVTVHRPLVGKPGTVLEVCGTPANLEMAAHVHDFLLKTSERLWREHKRQSGDRSDRMRRSYLAGVMRGFGEKLAAQAREQQREGLIWVRDAGLSGFMNSRHPRRTSVRSSSRAHPEAYAAGQRAGREIVLHRPVGSTGGGGVRLLPAAPRRLT